MQVDTQRNRIIATAALKKAEPLADQGINIHHSQDDRSLTHQLAVNFLNHVLR